MKTSFFRLLAALLLLPLLNACSSLGGAVSDAAKAAYSSGKAVSYATQPLNPQFTYLEVHAPTASALMVLASVESQASPNPPVQTWVTASKEVFRTQAGFFVSSQGVPVLWESATLNFSADGQPHSWVYDSPRDGLYSVKQLLKPVSVEQLNLKNSHLLSRARTLPGLTLKAWRAELESGSAVQAKADGLLQVVGVNSETGIPVYGMHCSKADYCIEYLYRTANANL